LNGIVVEHTPALSAAIPGNSAVYILGTEEQAKPAAFYMIDYMVKDSQKLTNTLAAGLTALENTKKFPSTINDEIEKFDKNTRESILFLQKFIGTFNQSNELSSTQAAGIVMDLPSSFCSHKFVYVSVFSILSDIKKVLVDNGTTISNIYDLRQHDQEENEMYWDNEDEENFDELNTFADTKSYSTKKKKHFHTSTVDDEQLTENSPSQIQSQLNEMLDMEDELISKKKTDNHPSADDIMQNQFNFEEKKYMKIIGKKIVDTVGADVFDENEEINDSDSENESDNESIGLKHNEGYDSDDNEIYNFTNEFDQGNELPLHKLIKKTTMFDDEDKEIQENETGNFVTTITGDIEIISKSSYYFFRGKEFERYSPYEFASICKIVKRDNLKLDKFKKQEDVKQNLLNENIDNDTGISGRPLNGCYELNVNHPEYQTKMIQINSKILVPILTGTIPKYPKNVDQSPETIVMANTFALYILSVYKESNLETRKPDGELNWLGFCNFIKYLAREDSSFIEKSRLNLINNVIKDFKTTSKKSNLIRRYQARKVIPWKDKDKSSNEDYSKGDMFDPDCEEMTDLELLREIGLNALQGQIKRSLQGLTNTRLEASYYCEQAKESYCKVFGLPVLNDDNLLRMYDKQINSTINDDSDYQNRIEESSNFHSSEDKINKAERILEICLSYEQAKLKVVDNFEDLYTEFFIVNNDNEQEQHQQHVMLPKALHLQKGSTYLDLEIVQLGEYELKPKQLLFCKLITFQAIEHLRHTLYPTFFKKPKQLFIFLLGGPGVGKTATIHEIILQIRNLSTQCGLYYSILKTTAMTGCAASLIGYGSQTLHRVLALYEIRKRNKMDITDKYTKHHLTKSDVPSNKWFTPLQPNQLVNCEKMFNISTNEEDKKHEVKILLTDEASNLGVTMLGLLNQRGKEITKDTTSLLGGFDYILSGDFLQFPPVGETSLPSAICEYNNKLNNKYALNTPNLNGVQLFSKFQFFQLDEQCRASEDPIHQSHIDELRNINTETPVTESLIKYLKKHVLNDTNKDKFKTTTLGVCSNEEIKSMQLTKIIAAAIERGLPVIAWRKRLAKKAILTLKKDNSLDALYRSNISDLYQFFLDGTKSTCFITDNISAENGVSNGMQCKLYGLQFENENDDEKVKTLMKNSKPGEIIFLQDIRPKYVLIEIDREKIVSNIQDTDVIVELDKDTPTNSQNEEDDDVASIDAIDNVTLTTSQKKEKKKKKFIFPIPESTYPENVTIGKCTIKVYGFPFSTEFLRTLNKLQGATKETILLNLNQRPAGLGNLPLTALTVALSRVKKGDDFAILPLDDDSSLDYLLKLKMSDNVKKLIHSIDEDTGFINVNKLVETSSDINFDGSLKIKKSVTNKKKIQQHNSIF